MTSSPHERLPRQGLLLLAMLSLCWGANWAVMKMVLSEVPPFYFRTICLLGGGAGLLCVARLSGVPIRVPDRQWRKVLWLATFNLALWNALVIIGISQLSSGRAALLGYTMPLWSTLLSIRFLGERLTARTVFGLLLGVAGIVVLLVDSMEGMRQAPVGVICMILGALSWAIGMVLFKRLPVAMPLAPLTGWMMLVSSVPMILLAIPLETPRLVVPGAGPILGVLYNVFISFMLCNWAWNRIMQMVPVSVSALSSLTVPLIGVLCGVVFLDEPLGWQEITASLLIVGAVGSVSIRR
jgi:drug/metabolite transporter (DMT)-like permease